MNAKLLIIQSIFFKYLIVIFIAFSCVLGNAQEVTSQAAFAEKVYLQLDRSMYSKGETIWYKAIVTQTKDNMPTPLSRVLYVELVDPNHEIISEKRIKLEQGMGNNFFDLVEFYTTGRYQIRAYTQWNRNFDTAFMYTTYIDVVDSSVKSPEKVISLLDDNADNTKFRASLNPKMIDSTVDKSIQIKFILDGKSDTYTIKQNRSGYFLLEEDLPESAKWATVELQTDSGKQWSKTFNVAPRALDLQFFAEGGNFIAGFNNVLAFKAVNQVGKGIPVAGRILDDSGLELARFKSDSVGMGRVNINPRTGEKFKVKLNDNLPNANFTFQFPEIMEKGSLLSINDLGERIAVGVKSSNIINDTIFLNITSRGLLAGEAGQLTKNGETVFFLPKESLPAGIVVFTLMDKERNPLAERLFFNAHQVEEIPFSVELDKPTYQTREKSNLSIKWDLPNKDTVSVGASVLVIPESFDNQYSKDDILSYFLLSSELKGKIERPYTYFDPKNKTRTFDLDNLMLTQGWRKYNFTAPPKENLEYMPEPTLNLSGEVGALFDKDKMKEEVNVSLMVFGEEKAFSEKPTDSLGKFYFALDDYFGKRVRAVLQTKNPTGRQRDYSISIDKHQSPKINYSQEARFASFDQSAAGKSIVNKIEKEVIDILDFDPNVNQLDEVLINDYEMTPQRQKVKDLYGTPDKVIDGKRIQEKAKDWSYGLFQLLRQHFDDAITFLPATDSIGNSYLKPRITVGFETLVLVDGIPVRNYEFNVLPTLSPSEVKSVEIIETTSKNFSRLYRMVYPMASFSEIPMLGSVLAIYTYSGNGIITAQKTKGILKTSVPVFSENKEFYSPKYIGGEETDITLDQRATIFWNPDVMLTNKKPTKLSFYNSDLKGTFSVIIEALTADGKIGYKKIQYKVEE